MHRGIAAGVALVVLVACAAKSRGGAEAASSPSITSITPTSGPAGTAYPIELTITGRNFSDTSNIVTFGPVTLKSVASTNGGTRIVVFAPKAIPSAGEVPPAPLIAGSYSVRVSSDGKTSNAVAFDLTREP